MIAHPKPLNPWQLLWRWLSVMTRISKNRRIHFLKCDEEGCVHVEFHDRIPDSLINKPCPRCGSNLMTKDQYIASSFQQKVDL